MTLQVSGYRRTNSTFRGAGELKKLVCMVAFLLLFAVPSFAATTMSVEDAVKQRSISSEDINEAKDAVSSINSDGLLMNRTSNLTADYDDAISLDYVKDLDIVYAYRKEGNLKSNLTPGYNLFVPVKSNGTISYALTLQKSGSQYEPVKENGKVINEVTFSKYENSYSNQVGSESVNSADKDIYDKNKIIQLFHSAGIDSVYDLQYVCTENYFIRLVYVDTPSGEYVIPYNCDDYGMKLSHGNVYKVSDMMNILEKSRDAKGSYLPNETANNVSSVSAKPIANKSVKTARAKFNFVPYICVISGVIIAGIILIFYFKRKKIRASH